MDKLDKKIQDILQKDFVPIPKDEWKSISSKISQQKKHYNWKILVLAPAIFTILIITINFNTFFNNKKISPTEEFVYNSIQAEILATTEDNDDDIYYF